MQWIHNRSLLWKLISAFRQTHLILTSNAQLWTVFNSPFEAGSPLGKKHSHPCSLLHCDPRSTVHASQSKARPDTIVARDIITSNLHLYVSETFAYHRAGGDKLERLESLLILADSRWATKVPFWLKHGAGVGRCHPMGMYTPGCFRRGQAAGVLQGNGGGTSPIPACTLSNDPRDTGHVDRSHGNFSRANICGGAKWIENIFRNLSRVMALMSPKEKSRYYAWEETFVITRDTDQNLLWKASNPQDRFQRKFIKHVDLTSCSKVIKAS